MTESADRTDEDIRRLYDLGHEQHPEQPEHTRSPYE